MTNKHSEYLALLALAETALTQEQSEEDDLSAIEAYCETFASFLPVEHNKAGQISLEQLGLTEAEVERLTKLHEKVMEKARILMGQTAGKLQNLQVKAKGIMAYVDILPKKISVTKSRKG